MARWRAGVGELGTYATGLFGAHAIGVRLILISDHSRA